MNCEHCNRILCSLSSLNYHKLHNKKCIEKQGLTNTIFSCSLCQKIFTSKDTLNKHICLKNEIYLEYNMENEVNFEKQRKIVNLENDLQLEKQRLENDLQLEKQRLENDLKLEKQRNIVNLENELNLEIYIKQISLEIESKNKKIDKYKNEIRVSSERNLELEIELELTKKELEIQIREKEIQRREIEKLDIHVERLENKITDLASQAVNKPTISNTTHNNFNLIPLDIGHRNNIKDNKVNLVENHYNLEYQINGQKGLAKLLSDSGVLKPKGDNIYVCSDSSRGIFKYKNENGIEIRDIQAKDLISWIQPNGVNLAEKNIKNEGLQRVSDLFECICSSETIETAQPFATEQNKLIEAHTSILNMNDDNKEFIRALGVCI
jgi:hypothetical protein